MLQQPTTRNHHPLTTPWKRNVNLTTTINTTFIMFQTKLHTHQLKATHNHTNSSQWTPWNSSHHHFKHNNHENTIKSGEQHFLSQQIDAPSPPFSIHDPNNTRTTKQNHRKAQQLAIVVVVRRQQEIFRTILGIFWQYLSPTTTTQLPGAPLFPHWFRLHQHPHRFVLFYYIHATCQFSIWLV